MRRRVELANEAMGKVLTLTNQLYTTVNRYLDKYYAARIEEDIKKE